MNITRIIREMTPTRYTKIEVAKQIGVSRPTIQRWKNNGTFVPTESRTFGDITVDLYKPEDIPVLMQIKKNMKPGRKPKNVEATEAGTD